MKLKHIPLEQLKPSPANVRKYQARQVDDLVPSIRTLGLIQPLVVRPNCDGFEIVAGQRRYHALRVIAGDTDLAPVPCILMEETDDAHAIEASLVENIARLPMDEIDQYRAFAALTKEGLSAEDIAARFCLSEKMVRQRLAIANLYSPILTAYRKGQIHASDLRLLTMASKAKQKDWFALFKSDDEHTPSGRDLKRWLFGGGDIPVRNALFAREDYEGAIIADLFGEDEFFDDASSFWALQNKAIAHAKERYLADGWQDVTILDVGAWWHTWEHHAVPKRDGGGVFIAIARDGEVTFHEGYVTDADFKKRHRADGGTKDAKPGKPELTKAMQNYLSLHRHAAVRADLLKHHGLALRLSLAQMIAGSSLWTVHADPQKTASPAIADSLATNKAEQSFVSEGAVVRGLLGLDADHPVVPMKHDYGFAHDLPSILARLIALDDEIVMRVFVYVVAQTLPCDDVLTEIAGVTMGTDPAQSHTPDEAFFDLLKDKSAINAMLADVAGTAKAASHVSDTAKIQKAILRRQIEAHHPDWTPRYFRFPMAQYTERFGITAMDRWQEIAALFTADESGDVCEAQAA